MKGASSSAQSFNNHIGSESSGEVFGDAPQISLTTNWMIYGTVQMIVLLHVTQLTGFKLESINFCLVEGSYKLLIKLPSLTEYWILEFVLNSMCSSNLVIPVFLAIICDAELMLLMWRIKIKKLIVIKKFSIELISFSSSFLRGCCMVRGILWRLRSGGKTWLLIQALHRYSENDRWLQQQLMHAKLQTLIFSIEKHYK